MQTREALGRERSTQNLGPYEEPRIRRHDEQLEFDEGTEVPNRRPPLARVERSGEHEVGAIEAPREGLDEIPERLAGDFRMRIEERTESGARQVHAHDLSVGPHRGRRWKLRDQA